MTSDADIAAQRLLDELAQVSLGVARDLADAIHSADDPAEMVSLAGAYAKVGRCLRMSVALAMRLRRGEALAPAPREARGLEPEAERDESDFIEERPERPEGLERESLYDRLPSGDLPTQVATVARLLTSAARTLPRAADYRVRCEALVAGARRAVPRPGYPPDSARRPPPQPLAGAARSRGPPYA